MFCMFHIDVEVEVWDRRSVSSVTNWETCEEQRMYVEQTQQRGRRHAGRNCKAFIVIIDL